MTAIAEIETAVSDVAAAGQAAAQSAALEAAQNPDGKPVDVDGLAGEHLAQFVDRIERLEEEKQDLMADIRDVYNEAKGTGFDPKVMRQIVRLRKMDQNDVDEQETLLHLYKQALGMH